MLVANLEESTAAEQTLDAGLETLQLAHRIDPRSIDAALELAHWEWAVMDNASAALRPFTEARDLSELALRDALTGLIDCYLELDQLENAQAVVQEGLRIFGSSDIDFSGFAEAIRVRKAAQ